MKLNCWEFFKCGRQPGGKNVAEFGQCSASVSKEYEGVNDGKCAGRFCWRVAGGQPARPDGCIVAEKIKNCHDCGFFQFVKSDEGDNFQE